MAEFRPFTEADWMGYAGAERFPSSDPENPPGEPWIAQVSIDGQPADAICDASGLAIHWGDSCISLATNTPQAMAYFLPATLDSKILVDYYGWQRESWK
jgi:hypothetical protein